jgi:RNA polymerase sigma-70 factor (ECF subfamily)
LNVTLEGDLLGLCRAGDLAAWRELYEQHVPTVYRVARRLGVPEGDCGDLCQDVFLRVFRGLRTFRGEAQFSTWLYRIVLHETARTMRARGVRNAFLALLGRQPVPTVGPDPLDRAQATRELERVLGRMKPKHREVFVLFELEELPLEQIAAALECPFETVRSRLRHARAAFERLRQQRLRAVAHETNDANRTRDAHDPGERHE